MSPFPPTYGPPCLKRTGLKHQTTLKAQDQNARQSINKTNLVRKCKDRLGVCINTQTVLTFSDIGFINSHRWHVIKCSHRRHRDYNEAHYSSSRRRAYTSPSPPSLRAMPQTLRSTAQVDYRLSRHTGRCLPSCTCVMYRTSSPKTKHDIRLSSRLLKSS